MKHTPLRRNAKLRTRRPTRKRRPTPRRRGEYEDKDYLAWLRTQQCRACHYFSLWESSQGSEAHHLRHDKHGASLGAHVKDDRRAISLGRQHHMDIELGWGPWACWTRAQIKAWENRQAAIQRAEYLAAKTRDPAQ